MRALRWHGTGDIRLDELPDPAPPEAGWVQIEVDWCGICGTDIDEWLNGPLFIRKTPTTLGHEISGRIRATGDGTTLTVGQRVGVDGISGCGECDWCRIGRVVLCTELEQVGLMSDGGLARFVNVPEALVAPVPDDAPEATGAMAETLAVGLRALQRGRLSPGESVLVVGGGAVGLLAAQAARAQGALVTLVERSASRRAVAEELGLEAHETVTGRGANLTLTCVGGPAAFEAGLAGTLPGGRLVAVGLGGASPALDLTRLVCLELEVIGTLSHLHHPDFRTAVDLISGGQVRIDPIISDRIPLTRVLDEGFRELRENPDAHLKILVDPSK